MQGEQKDFTVEYLEKVEEFTSYEKAMARFDELTERDGEKLCRIHVIVRYKGEMIAEGLPLVIDGVPVDF